MGRIFSGIPSWESARKALLKYDMLYHDYEPSDSKEDKDKKIMKEYVALSSFISHLFISDDGYVLDTGNFRDVNHAILEDIYNKARKHPFLWRLFMVC